MGIRYSNIGVGTGLTFLIVWLVLLIGWILNIASIFATLSEPITALFIARLFGIIAFPLGGILGYF